MRTSSQLVDADAVADLFIVLEHDLTMLANYTERL
jgi:hypothetical protein